jgi:hypothetical protein
MLLAIFLNNDKDQENVSYQHPTEEAVESGPI